MKQGHNVQPVIINADLVVLHLLHVLLVLMQRELEQLVSVLIPTTILTLTNPVNLVSTLA